MSGPFGLLRHYKGGWYLALGTTCDTTSGPTDGRRLVLYLALSSFRLYSRLVSEFQSPACMRDGCKMCPPRYMTPAAFRRWRLRGPICGT